MLDGLAGIGKSTVARTVAQEADSGRSLLNSNRSRPKDVSLSFVVEDETRKRRGARRKVARYIISP